MFKDRMRIKLTLKVGLRVNIQRAYPWENVVILFDYRQQIAKSRHCHGFFL